MSIRRIDSQSRKQTDEFIISRWFGLQMVVHGTVHDLHQAEGFVSLSDDAIIGMVTYEITDGTMEILSLDSLHENRGTGTDLVNAAIEEARKRDCRRILLFTTNDNTHALRFWQKRGFDLVRLYRNALDESRKLKPAIPMAGIDGIPLKHELELEMYL